MRLTRTFLLSSLLLSAMGTNAQCDTLDIDNVFTTNTTICEGGTVAMEVSGAFPTAAVLQWQILDAPDWVDIPGENDTTFVAEPDESASYRCFAVCGPSNSDSSEVIDIEVVNVVLSISSLAADTSCGAVNDTLVVSGAETYIWEPGSSLLLVPNDTVISTATVTTTYTVTGEIGGCSATDSVTVHVVPAPLVTHGGDTTFCAGDPDASIVFFFDGEGPWDVVINGPGGPFSETGNASGSFTINNPEEGDYLVDTLTTATCPNFPQNNGGPFEVTINEPPSAAVIQQAPDSVCQNSTGSLVAIPPTVGTGSWEQLSGPPVDLIPDTGAAVQFTPGQVGIYVFNWTVTNEPCTPPDTASVTVTVVPTAPPADAGDPITLCSGSDTTLQGNSASPGTGLWTIVSSPDGSLPTFSDPTDEQAVFTPDMAGDYLLRWTISNPPCDPSDSTVSITVVQTGSAPSILGLDDETACDGEYQTLMIQDPINGTTYSWACDAWEAPVPDGVAVTVHWAYGEDTLVTITVTPNGPCQVPSVDSVHVSPASASCPKGIVYFEPHGLAVLDETANYFQWGTLDDSRHFVPVDGWDEQTTFIPGLTNCDSSHYVVRTSIDGAQCWSTTVSCATSAMLDRPCPGNGGMVQEPHLRVFPNPSKGGPVTLEASGSDGDLLSIDVADLNGRTLSQGTLRMNGVSATTLDLDRLDRGIYVLRAWNDVFDRTIKLVID